MAPQRFRRRCDLAAYPFPCPVAPDTLTEHIRRARRQQHSSVRESVRRGVYSRDQEYTQYEEYIGDAEYTQDEGCTQDEKDIQEGKNTQVEEYTGVDQYTGDERHTGDEEQNEKNRHDPRDGEDDDDKEEEEKFFQGTYGQYRVWNNDDKKVERGLRAPQAVPMVTKRKVLTCTRAEALEMYHSIEELFEERYGCAAVPREIRDNFTKLVRVLPPHKKKRLKWEVDFHGIMDVVKWFKDVDLKEDLQELSWEETYQLPSLTPEQIHDTWEDLDHLAFHSSMYMASRMEARTGVLRMLFNEQTRRIKELEKELERKNLVVIGLAEAGVREALETLSNKATIRQGMRSRVKGFVKRVFCHRG
ncbi:hypothetical protein J3E68DRAFT_450072 [Trichoderma sp. SZMC 28012]